MLRAMHRPGQAMQRVTCYVYRFVP